MCDFAYGQGEFGLSILNQWRGYKLFNDFCSDSTPAVAEDQNAIILFGFKISYRAGPVPEMEMCCHIFIRIEHGPDLFSIFAVDLLSRNDKACPLVIIACLYGILYPVTINLCHFKLKNIV